MFLVLAPEFASMEVCMDLLFVRNDRLFSI